jgi:aminopeptidase-like protein
MFNCFENIEFNQTYSRKDPYVEPKLDKFNLWPTLGVGAAGGYKDLNYALLWFLNYADGRDLLDIATLSGQPLNLLAEVAKICEKCGLVKRT